MFSKKTKSLHVSRFGFVAPKSNDLAFAVLEAYLIMSKYMSFHISSVVYLFVMYPNNRLKFYIQFIGAIMGARDLDIQTESGHLAMPSNICCVVVEYLAGGSLKGFLIKNRRKKLAFKVVVQIALDLARG